MTIQEYFDELAKCLITFQYIEELLKHYINAADVAIYTKMKGFLHYEGHGKELWKQPLGPLIRGFDRRTDKKEIVASLRELAEDRNFFVHKGYLMTSEEVSGEKDIDEQFKRLAASHRKANKCLQSLVREACRISGQKISEDLLRQICELD